MAEVKRRQGYKDDIMQTALELHKKGMPYAQIGLELGMSGVQAFTYVKKAKEIARNEIIESAKDSIVTELLRLEDIVRANYEKAIDEGNYRAQDQLLKVHDRRVRLLGLDQANVSDANQSEFSQIDINEVDDKELEQVFNDIFTS